MIWIIRSHEKVIYISYKVYPLLFTCYNFKCCGQYSPPFSVQFSATQEIPRILCNPKFYYRIHKVHGTCSYREPARSNHILPHPTSWRSIKILTSHLHRDKWVHIITAWRVLRLRMNEWSPIPRVDAKILNTQSRTADNKLSFSLGIERCDNNASLY